MEPEELAASGAQCPEGGGVGRLLPGHDQKRKRHPGGGHGERHRLQEQRDGEGLVEDAHCVVAQGAVGADQNRVGCRRLPNRLGDGRGREHAAGGSLDGPSRLPNRLGDGCPTLAAGTVHVHRDSVGPAGSEPRLHRRQVHGDRASVRAVLVVDPGDRRPHRARRRPHRDRVAQPDARTPRQRLADGDCSGRKLGRHRLGVALHEEEPVGATRLRGRVEPEFHAPQGHRQVVCVPVEAAEPTQARDAGQLPQLVHQLPVHAALVRRPRPGRRRHVHVGLHRRVQPSLERVPEAADHHRGPHKHGERDAHAPDGHARRVKPNRKAAQREPPPEPAGTSGEPTRSGHQMRRRQRGPDHDPRRQHEPGGTPAVAPGGKPRKQERHQAPACPPERPRKPPPADAGRSLREQLRQGSRADLDGGTGGPGKGPHDSPGQGQRPHVQRDFQGAYCREQVQIGDRAAHRFQVGQRRGIPERHAQGRPRSSQDGGFAKRCAQDLASGRPQASEQAGLVTPAGERCPGRAVHQEEADEDRREGESGKVDAKGRQEPSGLGALAVGRRNKRAPVQTRRQAVPDLGGGSLRPEADVDAADPIHAPQDVLGGGDVHDQHGTGVRRGRGRIEHVGNDDRAPRRAQGHLHRIAGAERKDASEFGGYSRRKGGAGRGASAFRGPSAASRQTAGGFRSRRRSQGALGG